VSLCAVAKTWQRASWNIPWCVVAFCVSNMTQRHFCALAANQSNQSSVRVFVGLRFVWIACTLPAQMMTTLDTCNALWPLHQLVDEEPWTLGTPRLASRPSIDDKRRLTSAFSFCACSSNFSLSSSSSLSNRASLASFLRRAS